MKLLQLILATFFWAQLTITAKGDDADGDGKIREVRGLILGLDGKPAPNREVTLLGISPRGVGGGNIYKSDKEGRFSAFFGGYTCYCEMRTKPESNKGLPSLGDYAFVVTPTQDDAGAVSDISIPEDVPKGKWDLTIHIENGFRLEGRILDYENPLKPLKGVEVKCQNDLHKDTHTGGGGEIFEQKRKTDSQGRFIFAHVYPGEDPTMNISANWIRTKKENVWIDGLSDEVITYDGRAQRLRIPKPGVMSHIEIEASKKNLFRYYGRVISWDGKPAAGAEVALHNDPDSYHGTFETALTDTNGNYSIMAGITEWSNMTVTTNSYVTISATLFSPCEGKNDFTLDRQGIPNP